VLSSFYDWAEVDGAGIVNGFAVAEGHRTRIGRFGEVELVVEFVGALGAEFKTDGDAKAIPNRRSSGVDETFAPDIDAGRKLAVTAWLEKVFQV
jgi:hypothetical protein